MSKKYLLMLSPSLTKPPKTVTEKETTKSVLSATVSSILSAEPTESLMQICANSENAPASTLQTWDLVVFPITNPTFLPAHVLSLSLQYVDKTTSLTNLSV